MNYLTPVAGWDKAPQLETDTIALGGPGGPLNSQAQALLNRTEWLRSQSVNVCDPKFAGGAKPGLGDIGPALQAAHDALPAAGGAIYFPSGLAYLMTTGVTFTKNVRLVGDGKLSTTVKCSGKNGGVPFVKQTAGDILGFEGITMAGDGVTTGPIAVAGSICYQASNNAYSVDAEFIFWDVVSQWAGGYYHRHFNSYFEYSRLAFKDYDQNNVGFFGCRFATLQNIMTVASGEGPITLSACSIENIADKAFTSYVGRQVALNVYGGYFENYAGTSCPSGITSSTGKFDKGVLVYSNGAEIYPIVIDGLRVFTTGLFRLVYCDSAAGCNVQTRGVTFINRGGAATADTFYSLSGASISARMHDEVVGGMPAGAVYVSGLPTDLKGCAVFDPVGRDFIKPVAKWTAAAVQNGWTDVNGTAGYTVAPDGRVSLRGTVSGGSATDATIFTLPAALRPVSGKFFVCSYNSGFIGVRVLPSGQVFLDAAVGAAMNLINLDPISFYIGS